MSKVTKTIIVIALIAIVIIVITIKQQQKLSTSGANTDIITVEEKAADLKNSSEKPPLPKLIELGADKCLPCKMMAPLLAELKTEYKDRLEISFIDVWKKPDKAKKYGIKIIPTQIFYDASGKELFRHEGFFSKENILARWKILGIEL